MLHLIFRLRKLEYVMSDSLRAVLQRGEGSSARSLQQVDSALKPVLNLGVNHVHCGLRAA